MKRALGLTPESVRARLEALGFDDDDAALLVSMRDELAGASERFVSGFYEHLRRFDEIAGLLASNATVERLERSLRHYFQELTSGVYDLAYVERRVRVGLAHHAVRLSPKWYVAAYARYVVECIPAIVSAYPPAEVGPRVTALLRLVLFDAGIGLESYGLLREREIAQESGTPDGGAEARGSVTRPADASADAVSGRAAEAGDATPSSDMPPLSEADLSARMAFIGITPRDGAVLRELGTHVGDAIGEVVRSFRRATLASRERASYLGGPGVVERLEQQQTRYWQTLLRGELDSEYVSGRVRCGHVHERIGLPPHLYLGGMGFQLGELARVVIERSPRPVEALQSLCRAVFLDVTLVIEAYLVARLDALLHMPEFARRLLPRIPHGVLVVDSACRITSANNSALSLLASDPTVLLGMNLGDALSVPGLREAVEAVLEGRLQTGELVCRLSPSARASSLVRVRVVPVGATPTAEPEHVAVLLDDVSSVMELGERAQRTEHRWRGLIDSVEGIVWEMDRDTGAIDLIGGRALPVLGFPADHWLAQPGAWVAQIPPPRRARWKRDIASLTEANPTISIEHPMLGADGKRRWLHSRIRRDSQCGRVVLKGISVDITEIRRMRTALSERLRNEEILHDMARRAIITQDPGELGLRACQSLTRARGIALVACSDVSGESVHAWGTRPERSVELSPEWRAVVRRAAPTSAARGRGAPEITDAMLDEIGAEEILVVPVNLSGSQSGALLIASRARIGRGTVHLVRTLAAILSQTLRRRELERKVAHRQTLEALGTLAAGVAHDFGNVLAAIQSQAELGQLEGTASPNARTELRAIHETSARGSALVKEILAFTRPHRSGGPPRRLRDVVARAADLVRHALPRQVQLDVELTSDARSRIDPLPLERLLLNLCRNACDAMGGGGRIAISLSPVARRRVLPALERVDLERLVELSVRDHGAGIPGDVVERVTEPFFTTRPSGSGLGLAIVEAITVAHGGALAFEPAPGGGTLVRVQLPVEREHGPGAVLVLDDDIVRLDALRHELDAAGFEVTACSGGDVARSVLPETGYRVDAIVMRPWDGRMLAELVRRWPSAIAVVIDRARPREGALVVVSPEASPAEVAAEITAALEG